MPVAPQIPELNPPLMSRVGRPDTVDYDDLGPDSDSDAEPDFPVDLTRYYAESEDCDSSSVEEDHMDDVKSADVCHLATTQQPPMSNDNRPDFAPVPLNTLTGPADPSSQESSSAPTHPMPSPDQTPPVLTAIGNRRNYASCAPLSHHPLLFHRPVADIRRIPRRTHRQRMATHQSP